MGKTGIYHGTMYFLTLLICYKSGKEKVLVVANQENETEKESAVAFGTAIKRLFKNKYLVMILVMNLFLKLSMV